MRHEISAGVLVYYEDPKTGKREYLLLHYPSGHWDLPKGKLEKEETNKEAAIRELKEETGLVAKLLPGFEEPLFYFFNSRWSNGSDIKSGSASLVSKKVTFFLGKVDTKEVILSHEHIGYKWLKSYDAYQFLTFQNAQQILKLADDFLVMRARAHKK